MRKRQDFHPIVRVKKKVLRPVNVLNQSIIFIRERPKIISTSSVGFLDPLSHPLWYLDPLLFGPIGP